VIEREVRQILIEQKAAGKYEDSTASYQSPLFPVSKKESKLRLVADVQELIVRIIFSRKHAMFVVFEGQCLASGSYNKNQQVNPSR
jgi:hypothetical protein